MRKPYLNLSIEYIKTDIDIVTASDSGADFNADELWQGFVKEDTGV